MAPRSSRAAACALIALLGCSHAPVPQPAPTPAAPQANAPAPTPAPEPQEEAPVPAPRLEASEVITTDELASIPDPVPGAGTAPIEERPLNPDAKPLPVAPSKASTAPPPTPPSAATAPETTSPETAPPSTGVWRVQVFASPDRAQAERVAREAAQTLGAPYVLTKDGDLVKVRLGSFVREEEAQALKERAVERGYPGAFRVLDKGGS
jgi:hypothetical protein